MKKLTFFLSVILCLGWLLQSCNNSKTYAEMVSDEKKAINKYIKDNNIKVLSNEVFEKDTVTAENAYVLFASGVYMHIIDRGNLDEMVRNNEIVTVRFDEIELTRDGEEGMYTNKDRAYPDTFTYIENQNYLYGLILLESEAAKYYEFYLRYASVTLQEVPTGWLAALKYIGNGGHVRMIIPHKHGHAYSTQYVIPFYYDIKFRFDRH